jgi:transcription antitermination factor NusG
MCNYYAIHVRKGFELNVKNILSKNHADYLQNRGVQIIIPEKKAVQEALILKQNCAATLPGYLIIRCHELTDELYYLIRHTFGVIRVFKDSIPLKEMQDFLKVLNNSLRKEYLRLAIRLSREKGYRRIMSKIVSKSRKVIEVNQNKGILLVKLPILHLLN